MIDNVNRYSESALMKKPISRAFVRFFMSFNTRGQTKLRTKPKTSKNTPFDLVFYKRGSESRFKALCCIWMTVYS